MITFLLVAALNRYVYVLISLLLCVISFYFLRKSTLPTRFLYTFAAGILLLAVYFLSGFNMNISLSFTGFGTLFSTSFAAIIAFLGLLEFSRSQLHGLKLFRMSILVSIFLTQFFLFYRLQFLALIGLILNILMLLTIEYVISKKESITEASEVNVKR
jgi:hypothetical protein